MQTLTLSHSLPPPAPCEPGQSLDEYRHLKLLPHITAEYEYRITNRLLLQKIRNPRRDKIIMDSLSTTTCSNFWRKRKCTTRNQSANYRRKNAEEVQQKRKGVPVWQKAGKEKLVRKVRMPKTTQLLQKEGHLEGNPCISAHDDFTEKQESMKRVETEASYSREALVGRIVKNDTSYFQARTKNLNQSHSKHSSAAFADHPLIKNQRYVLSEQCQPQRPMKRIIRKISPSAFHNKQNTLPC